jgi:hypothetical protein
MKIHPTARRISLMLFDIDKRTEKYPNLEYLKFLNAAEITIEKLEEIVKNSEIEKFRYRINPKIFYDLLKIKEVRISEKNYVYIIQALLNCSGLKLNIQPSGNKSGRVGYWFDLSPDIILQFREKLHLYSNPTLTT